MIHRILDICEEGRYLAVSRGFLQVKSGADVLGQVPLDDIGSLLVSSQDATLSKNVLNALSERGCPTYLCGKNYAPLSVVLPIAAHFHATKVLKDQISCTKPLQKQVWQKVVTQKILHQAHSLRLCGSESGCSALEDIAATVRSGDTDNREGYAARLYWQHLFGAAFRRDQDGDGANAMLNYGYAVMRSAMARAVCAAGLHPALGVHHKNELDQFCLVDDLFEPFRPIVDFRVFCLLQEGQDALTPAVKRQLAALVNERLIVGDEESPAFRSMHHMTASYTKLLENRAGEIEIPQWR